MEVDRLISAAWHSGIHGCLTGNERLLGQHGLVVYGRLNGTERHLGQHGLVVYGSLNGSASAVLVDAHWPSGIWMHKWK